MANRIGGKSAQNSASQRIQSEQVIEKNGGNAAVASRPRANEVPGGLRVGGLIDKTSTASVSTSTAVMSAAPKFTGPAPKHITSQSTNTPSSSSSSSSSSASSGAQSTPQRRTAMGRLDFSQPGTVAMVEQAAAKADIHELASMIEQGAAQHVSPECRNILMHRLVKDMSLGEAQQCALGKTLIEAGVKAQGSYGGKSFICSAISSRSFELVLLLIDHGADINAKDEKGNTALMLCASHHDDQQGQLLIINLMNHKPRLNAVNGEYRSALLIAAANGNTKCLRTLLQAHPKLDQKDNRHQGLLINAVRSKNINTVRTVLELELKVDQRDYKGETALFHAISLGDIDMVKLLIRSGADINKGNRKGETPLARACRGKRSQEMIGTLLKSGADPYKEDNKGREPIDWIDGSDRNYYETLFAEVHDKYVKALKAKHTVGAEKADFGVDPQTVLFNAIADNRVDILLALFQLNYNFNSPNQDGETPLSFACQLGLPAECIRALLGAGADPNIKDNKGRSPLSRAKEGMRDEYERIFREFDSRKTDTAGQVRNAGVGRQAKNQ